jgi:glycosyltransferase involved in cell wall biosynthesis
MRAGARPLTVPPERRIDVRINSIRGASDLWIDHASDFGATRPASVFRRAVSRAATGVAGRRLLIFVVAYNAERTIEAVLARVPQQLADRYDTEVLVIDDSSTDRTFERGDGIRRAASLHFKLHVLFNPENQGYGGNQKIGFHFAIENGFDFVALVHGDGQYAPECLPDLVRPIADDTADAVLGSRMLMPGDARRGGMPLYKLIGNRILTAAQNRLLHAGLSEFHSGYRVYSVDALRRIPFDLNTNDFHFDTEIIIQLTLAGMRIREVAIPTYYGEEICHVNGMKYARDVIATTARARIQELSLLYDRKFDLSPSRGHAQYTTKFDHDSPHRFVLDFVVPGSRVLDLGCAGGFVGARLRERGCFVVGVDRFPLASGVELDAFHLHDLNEPDLPVDATAFDYVLLLDVIEHLRSPEQFAENLASRLRLNPDVKLVLSTGNVGFLLLRMLLAVGQFNYGKRGILDLTHTRLFTCSSLCRLLDGAGFRLVDVHGVPAPFPLALGEGRASRVLLGANIALARLRKQLFAYQILVVAQPRPSLEFLLARADSESRARSEMIAAAAGAAVEADDESDAARIPDRPIPAGSRVVRARHRG